MKVLKFIKQIFTVTDIVTIAANTAPPLWGWNFDNNENPNPIYDPGIPKPRHYQTIVYSTCGNNGQHTGPDIGYACPHMMLFSTDMILAAKHDGLQDDFYYAVGGGGHDDQDCGRCYQVQPFEPESINEGELRQLVIQVINSGFDVMNGQFDVFVAAGGFGHFNGCSKDCTDKYCAGGPCTEGQYETDYKAWNPDTLHCYGGGVRLVNNKTSDIVAACTTLAGSTQDSYKVQALFQSCLMSNVLTFHQNFISSNSIPVRCPEGLSRLTGLRRTDEQDLPIPHKSNQLVTHCHGNKTDHRYCLSTMADCCMPSCSWNNKGLPDPLWSRVDSCRKDGTLYNYP